MDEELEELAARFRRAAESERGAAAEAAADRATRLEEGRIARAALLDDLEAFGRAVGILEVLRDGDMISWSHETRSVVIEAAGQGDKVRLSWKELTSKSGRLYREALLDDRWVLIVEAHGREIDRVPLRDTGLERLLLQGLRLPKPSDDVVAAPERAPTRTLDPEPASAAESEEEPEETPKRRL
jgi:hypothetical protein